MSNPMGISPFSVTSKIDSKLGVGEEEGGLIGRGLAVTPGVLKTLSRLDSV